MLRPRSWGHPFCTIIVAGVVQMAACVHRRRPWDHGYHGECTPHAHAHPHAQGLGASPDAPREAKTTGEQVVY